MSYDIVIAGAGPVGLCLALRLAKAQKKVLVLEKNPTTHEHSRAPAIWPRTQEILSELGVIDQFLQEGITRSTLELTDVDTGKVLLDIPLHELRNVTQYPQLLVVPQSKTEKILSEHVRSTANVDLFFSSELHSFTQDANTVQIQYTREGSAEEVAAQYLIGCDGAHSTVRDILGATLEGETYGMRAALSDVTIETEKPFPLLSTAGVFVVALQIDTTLWRLILIQPKSGGMTLEESTQQAMKQLFPGEPYESIWSSEFRLHNRISTRFVDGRVALAGDAAHLNSPVGGQGMNAGIHDTVFLGNALLKALDEHNPSHLAAYGKERQAQIRNGVNKFTDTLTDIVFWNNGALFKVVVRAWNVLLKIPLIRTRFLKRLAMLP